MPTSRGSNLWGDSPTVLLLREAESDSSGLVWKEEREELVSSVMEDRKGVLSEVTAAGVGQLGVGVEGGEGGVSLLGDGGQEGSLVRGDGCGVSGGGGHAGHQAVPGLR